MHTKPLKCTFCISENLSEIQFSFEVLSFFKRIFLAVAGSQSLPERFERCEVKEVNFPQPLLGDEFQANPFNVRLFYISTRRNATSVYSGIVLNCVGF